MNDNSEFILNTGIHNGITMKFSNGNTISIQFAKTNYSNGKTNAEVAAWDADGEGIDLSGNQSDVVVGWQTTDQVADIIEKVKSL